MEENITVYTPAAVSREAYEPILQQLDAQFKVMPVYDALISCDNRHARFVRHTKEDSDPYGLLDEEDESVKMAARILGEQPQTRIEISTNRQVGSVNILVDFVLLFASQYPCVVIDAFLEGYTPEEFAQRAEAGYDGYRWDAEHTRIVKNFLDGEWNKEKNRDD